MEPEEIWSFYQDGIAYKSALGLYDAVARNERFFAGDQWAGVHAPDLPKPVLNFIKRACQQRIAEVRSAPVRVVFEALDMPGGFAGGARVPLTNDAQVQLLQAVFDADWERLQMDAVSLDALQDACLSGDGLLYLWWDAAAATGQPARGMARVETVDNVDYYPADPKSRDVQSQPHIVLTRREPIARVRAEAAAHGLPRQDCARIAPESDTGRAAGDLSRLYGAEAAGGECLTLLCLWKDAGTGHVFAQKVTRDVTVRPAWDTLLTRYPLAMMNWELRKNSCHGRAEATGLVPAQRYVNQMYAMAMLFTMQCALPKPVFNQGLVRGWSSAVGAAIPVNGDVDAAVKYLAPPALPADVYRLPETLKNQTLELLGVSEIELGSVSPTNTSAMALARQASSVPIQTIRTRFYRMLEDFARCWLDMAAAYQSVPRWVPLREKAGRSAALFDAAALRGRLWNVRIDVGTGSFWDAQRAAGILADLYAKGAITAREYLERLPDDMLPMRASLLAQMDGRAPGTPKG